MLIDTMRCFGSVTSPYRSVGSPLVAARGPDSDEPKTEASWVGVTGAFTPAIAVTVGPGVEPGGVGPTGLVGPEDEALAVGFGDAPDEPDELLLHAASPAATATTATADFMCTKRE